MAPLEREGVIFNKNLHSNGFYFFVKESINFDLEKKNNNVISFLDKLSEVSGHNHIEVYKKSNFKLNVVPDLQFKYLHKFNLITSPINVPLSRQSDKVVVSKQNFNYFLFKINKFFLRKLESASVLFDISLKPKHFGLNTRALVFIGELSNQNKLYLKKKIPESFAFSGKNYKKLIKNSVKIIKKESYDFFYFDFEKLVNVFNQNAYNLHFERFTDRFVFLNSSYFIS